jgi:hypothetical protein
MLQAARFILKNLTNRQGAKDAKQEERGEERLLLWGYVGYSSHSLTPDP